MSVLVAGCVLAAVLLGLGPSGRVLRAGLAPRGRGGTVLPGRRRRARAGADDLPALLLAVAARLRAGAPAGTAWSQVLGAAVPGSVPRAEDVVARVSRARRPDARLVGRVRAVVAGSRVAVELGAPLAEVLDDLAAAASADAEHAADVEAALAGPGATARVLLWLPVAGLGLGTLMGARPWEVLLGGGAGTGLLVLGVGLVVAGRAWVGALLARARRAGTPSVPGRRG